MSTTLPSRPIDATLTVTKAARLLGVHPNTVRAWSDAGRLRYYRINPRGDRRYRMGDLQRFLAAAEFGPAEPAGPPTAAGLGGRRMLHALPSSLDRRADGGRQSAEPHRGERYAIDLSLIDAITRLTAEPDELDDDLASAVRLLRDAYDHHLVAIWELRDDRLVPRAVAHDPTGQVARLGERPRGFGVLGAALAAAALPDDPSELGHGRASTGIDELGAPLAILSGERPELAAVIPSLGGAWGVLHVVGEATGTISERDGEVASVVANAIGTLVSVARRRDEVAHQLHRAEALHRVAGDIGSRLDLDRILSGLVDHAMVLFEADRAAVFLQRPGGTAVAEVSRNLSASYLGSVRDFPRRSLPTLAVAERRPMFAVDYANDPRGLDVRAAAIQEGFDTICTAPLFDGAELLGLLNVYHDRAHAWSEDDLETMAALATQASVAIRAAQDFERMATWAAQLRIDPAARHAAEPALERPRHRDGHRHRAAPDHRLPQRPRVPAHGERPHPRRDEGPGRRIRR